MPDIQAGDIEVTKEEAQRMKIVEEANQTQLLVDEKGEPHDESVYNHLGRS